MPELIDTHVHLDDARLIKDLDLIFGPGPGKGRYKDDQHWPRYGIQPFLGASCPTYGKIWAAVGIHPNSAPDAREADFHLLEELTREDKVSRYRGDWSGLPL